MFVRRSFLQFVIGIAALFGVSAQSFASLSPIDSISLRAINGLGQYSVADHFGFFVMVVADTYNLHDGTSWKWNSSSSTPASGMVASVTQSGSQISYALDIPTGTVIFNDEDYDNLSLNSTIYSSYGVLVSTGPLVITATEGSDTGYLSGFAKLTVNEPAPYSQPGNVDLFNAAIGDLVPFNMTYTLLNATFTPDLPNGPMVYYKPTGTLDFADAVAPEPMGLSFIMSAVACILLFRPRQRTNL